MAIAYFLVVLLALSGARWRRKEKREEFAGKEQCASLKGISILAMVITHTMIFLSGLGYAADSALDVLGRRIQEELFQLPGVVFLFYSGYGVMESIKSKGSGYLASFPRKRMLATLLNFDVGVACFIAAGLALGTEITVAHAVLALAGWTSVGVPDWYMFVILCCYGMTYAAFRLLPGRREAAAWLVLGGVVALEMALAVLKNGRPWWYNTAVCYPAGVLFSLHREWAVGFCRRHCGAVFCGLAATFVFLHAQGFLPECRGLTYNLEALAFVLLVVVATMKVEIGNPALKWLGEHLFPFYVYHMLPMMLIGGIAGNGWIVAHPYGFAALSFAAACAIAHFHEHWSIKL